MKYNKLSFTLSAILLFCVNLMMAQSTIRGTVTDSETGDAVPGANVVIIEFPQGFRTTTMHRFGSLFRGARKFPRTAMAVGTGATLFTGSMLWQSYVEMQNNSNNILWDIKARLKSIQGNIFQ